MFIIFYLFMNSSPEERSYVRHRRKILNEHEKDGITKTMTARTISLYCIVYKRVLLCNNHYAWQLFHLPEALSNCGEIKYGWCVNHIISILWKLLLFFITNALIINKTTLFLHALVFNDVIVSRNFLYHFYD